MLANRFVPLVAFCLSLVTLLLFVPAGTHGQKLELKAGAHISIIGNTMADRMQHDGWLETLTQARFPGKQVVFRELGFSGDELETRLRSQDFGAPAEWLKRCKTDVVIAMFGYNESFADEAGLENFQQQLTRFVIQTRTQKYNGTTSPTIVLVSPIACENIAEKSGSKEPVAIPAINKQGPDFSETNRRLAMYTEAMRKVADTEQVFFVDLFQPTLQKWASTTSNQFTINGVHLNRSGNRVIAGLITNELFGPEPEMSAEYLASLRAAVVEKNWHWFHRYRTTDGYSIFGGRADLAFTDGQTNREVAAREMEILDYMTAERDRSIHAVAQGKDYTPDDANAPPLIPVISNKPGEGPNGEHLFLGGVEAISKMEVHPGMSVNLFASEEQFPELASPVQMSFDTRGRLWVAAWPTYPHWQPLAEKMDDKLLIFSDTDNDGAADKVKVFADGLTNPTGFEFWNGGVIIAQAPDLWFLKDTDGDDVADVRMRILHGIDSADTHHTSNSFTMGPDGALYFQEGTFHHSQIENPWGPPLRQVNAGVFRYEPRRQTIESYISYGFANPHGHVFDEWGQDFVTDGTGNENYYAAPFSGRLDYPQKHSSYFRFFQQSVRPAGATELISGGHFPEEFQGNYLIANVIGFQGLLRYQIHDDESGFAATEVKPVVRSSDPNFRPVDIEMGPDGAIYFVDWQNPIIGHMQHNLRDPNRDKIHGRIYRVSYNDRPLDTVLDLTTLSVAQLLDQLKSPNSRTHYRTRLELSGRNSAEVLAAVDKWVADLDANDPAVEHHLLEALWLTRQHNAVSEALLQRVSRSSEPRARAAAVRVLCYSRHQIRDVLSLLRVAVNDPYPRVRLEAVRALSFIQNAEAAEIALQVLKHPTDKFIDYCLNETLRSSEPAWRAAIVAGKSLADDNEAGLRFLMDRLSPAELASMARSKLVNNELLTRPGILHEARMEAAESLARAAGTDARAELLTAIARLDASDAVNSEPVLADLTHLFLNGDGRSPHSAEVDSTDLSKYVTQLHQLASEGRKPITRQIAFATLMQANQSIDELWESAQQSPLRFRDLVAATALVDVPALKADLAPRIAGLFSELPKSVSQAIDQASRTSGRYVRIELPGDSKTLTLAEVQVFADGRNVATGGTTTQSTTNHDGTPEQAIDGDSNPVFSEGSQTHTIEDKPNPWWQVDLGSDFPIERVVIWNRVESEFGKRLDGFTLRVLNADQQEVFIQTDIPAPDASAELPMSGDPVAAIRNAAIGATVHLSAGEQSTFAALAGLVLQNTSRAEAVRGLSRLPRRSWIDSQIEALVGDMIAHLEKLNTSQRTMPTALDEISLARKLATALPVENASRFREKLKELGVNVVVLRPLPHRMQYDRNQFFVEAGKPFQLVLDNTDIMPHNVVITTPGAYAKVGIAAELMVNESGTSGQAFIPNMPEVLFATKLLQPGQVQQMEIRAPEQVGQYPYVCTYPGHWRRMYGVMHVVSDMSEAPVEAFAPTIDAEIAMRPFVREWVLADFNSDLAQADQSRSFEQGRALFTELSCVQCHQLGKSEGGDIGPNLIEVREKLTRGELNREGILKSLVEPSTEINEKFRTWIVQDVEGRVFTGVVAERTGDSIRLLANPLDKGEPITIAIDDIEEEIESKVSMMPAGLLNTCSKAEILDLLIFVESGGDPENPLWKK